MTLGLDRFPTWWRGQVHEDPRGPAIVKESNNLLVQEVWNPGSQVGRGPLQ